MKIISALTVFLLLVSINCYSQPGNSIIENDVKEFYRLHSQAIGAASTDIKKINIDEIIKLTNDTFVVKVTVKGNERNYTIANSKKKKFKHIRTLKYFLNDKKEWDYIIENDPRKR